MAGKDIYQDILNDPNLDDQQKLDFLNQLPPPPKAGAISQTGSTSVGQMKAANPEAGSGISTVKQGEGFVEGEGTGTSVLKDVARVGIPGAMVAGAEALASPLGPMGMYPAGAAAGGAAEALLQEFGLNRKDPYAILGAMAVPPTGRALMSGGAFALNKGLHLIPGVNQAARGFLTPEARMLGEKLFQTPVGSEELYKQLAQQSGGSTKLTGFPHLRAVTKDMKADIDNISLEQLQTDMKTAGLENLFTNIETALSGRSVPNSIAPGLVKPTQPQGMTFVQAKANIQAMGKMIGNTADPNKRASYKRLYSAMLDDLEQMEAPQGIPVSLWKEAREAYKTEKTRTMFQDIVEKNTTPTEGVPLVNPDGILKALKTNKKFAERLSEQEMATLTKSFTEMAKLTGKNPQRLMGVLAGMAITHSAGGALTGYVASDLLSKAMMSETGRTAVMNLLKKNGPSEYFRRGGSIIASMLFGGLGAERASEDQVGNPFTGEQVGTLPGPEVRTEPPTFEKSAPVPPMPKLTQEDIKAKIKLAAKERGLPPALALATADLESGFDNNKVGTKDDVGIYQITGIGAKDVGLALTDRYDPYKNIEGGLDLLGKHYQRYKGDEAKALAAYNAGASRVEGGKIPASTQAYVAEVLKRKAKYDDKKRK